MKLFLRLVAVLVPLAVFGQTPVPDLHARLARGASLNDAEWRRVLWSARAFDVPHTWVDDQPLAISMRVPAAIPGAIEIRARPRRAGLASLRAGALTYALCFFGDYIRRVGARNQEVGLLPAGAHRLELDVVVERGATWAERSHLPRSLSRGELWSGRLAFDITVLDDVAGLLTPIRSEIAGRTLGASLQAFGPKEDRATLVAYVCLPWDAPPLVDRLGFSLDIMLVRDGHVLERAPFPVVRDLLNLDEREARVELQSPSPTVLADERELARYALRITGTGEHMRALHRYEARWAGSVEVPLRAALEQGQK